MDTIKFLIGLMIRLVIAFLFVYVIWWLVSTFFPNLKPKNLFSFKGEFLPAPGSLSFKIGNSKVPDQNTNVFNGYAGTDANRFYGNQANLISYTGSGAQAGNTKYVNPYAEKSLYIRNLSIFEGGKVYSNMTFIGEARDTMFKDGKFLIIIADKTGHPVSLAQAVSTGGWAVAGWSRFQVKLGPVIPNNVQCIMVFQSANNESTRVAIPVVCSNF